MRKWRTFTGVSGNMRSQLVEYARRFSVYALLNSCDNSVYGENTFDLALAAGARKKITASAGTAFRDLKNWMEPDHCFGFFGYDLKNETEALHSRAAQPESFDDLHFFIPEILILVRNGNCEIGLEAAVADEQFEKVWEEIKRPVTVISSPAEKLHLQPRVPRELYLDTLGKIREHIVEGDIYEMNFCQEFYAENCSIDPLAFFEKLCDDAKAPFSVLFRWENKYLISASPERFLKKTGDHLLSQPIKGTSRRGTTDTEDKLLKEQLRNSIKNRAENVMIVDLVRNDLTKSSITGTIRVPELFGIYTFERVHQMISSVTSTARPEMHPVDIIKNAFPMGSMTGAPKVKAMELIEKYEHSRRGIYSGAFGYFTPDGDFDFNVIIRSIVYLASIQYVSVHVGGAIVFDSVAEEEYDECLVKLYGVIN